MRRSDSAAQRGTSISHPTPPGDARLPRAARPAVLRDPAAALGADGARLLRAAGLTVLRDPAAGGVRLVRAAGPAAIGDRDAAPGAKGTRLPRVARLLGLRRAADIAPAGTRRALAAPAVESGFPAGATEVSGLRGTDAAPRVDDAALPATGLRGTGGRGRDGRPHLVLVRPLDEQVAADASDAGTGLPRGFPAARIARTLADLDRQLVVALRTRGGNPAVAGAARVLGQAGEHGAVWIAAGAAGALGDPGRRGAWVRATAVVGASHVASMGIKRLVRRPRPHIPCGPLVRTAGRHSFPSSHATSSAAAAVAFGALLPGTAAVPVLAAAICVSRLVAGVHYPSDVVCGALLGATAAGLGRGWALGAAQAGGGGFHG